MAKKQRPTCHHCGQTVLTVYGPDGVQKLHKNTGRARDSRPAKDSDGRAQRGSGHYAQTTEEVETLAVTLGL